MNNSCHRNGVIGSGLQITDDGGICNFIEGNIGTAGSPVHDAEVVLGDPHVHRSPKAQGNGTVAKGHHGNGSRLGRNCQKQVIG